jgi:transcriptional regulator with XRE-family HTH domain
MAGTTQLLNKSNTTLNKRLTEVMKKRGITIIQLSKNAKVAVGTIQKIMNDPNCNPTIGSLEAICNVLDITISELIGEEQKLHNLLGKSVYILTWEDISSDFKNLKNIIAAKSSSAEFIKTFTPLGEDAFVLKMKDDSMLPIFHEGSILIFDPDKRPYSNSFVLVKLNNYDPIVFKQLIIDEPNQYIKSVNPLLTDNLTPLETQDKIIATLVEAKTQY